MIPLLVLAVLLQGCGPKHAAKKTKSAASGTTTITLAEEKYALILPNEENAYDDLEAAGFSEIMEKANRNYVVERPRGSSTKEQRRLVQELIDEEVSCIAIAPNDAGALEDVLKSAMEKGISVCSFDRPSTPESRELFINATSNEKTAETMLDSVLELTGGSGQWAVLTSTAAADRHSGWTDSLREQMKKEAYAGLELLEIAYGNESVRMSYDQTKALLQNYPDLKVICCMTSVCLPAACRAVRDAGSDVRLTGFGLPSEMKEYTGDDAECPFFFLRNPHDVGMLTACVSVALHENQITGAMGESFRTQELGTFEVTKAADGGTEVVVGSPYRFSRDNIEYWAKFF